MNKIVTIAGISIDIPDTQCGIMLSGGADSAILYYILLLHSTKAIHVYTCGSANNGREAPVTSYNIIRECMKRIDRRDIFQHTYFVDVKVSQEMYDATHQITSDLDIVYMATTNTPDDAVMNSFKHLNKLYSDRNPNVLNKPYYVGPKMRFYRPFVNLNKKNIYDLYKELDALEWLFPLTISCEKNPISNTEHCDNCWWCEERRWAFGRLI